MGTVGGFLLLLPEARNKLIRPLPHSFDALMEAHGALAWGLCHNILKIHL